MRFAVLDLGSTSFQLLITDADTTGSLDHLVRERVILNLGAEVAATGRVSEELLDRALGVVARFRDIAERSNVDRVLAVATAAFRDAANKPWLAKALRGALGQPIRILAGDEEVKCTVAGIRASVSLPEEPWIAFDLGGGSLEIAVMDGERLVWTDTYPLGAARMAATSFGSDPMTRTERRELRRLVTEMLEPARAAGFVPAGATCVLAGGTAGALARLLAAERWPDPPNSLNQYELSQTALADLSKALTSIPSKERLELPGIDRRRVDLLPAGSIILSTALKVFRAGQAVHSEWGLREGVVLRDLDAPAPASAASLRAGSVERLARQWSADDGHATVVARLAEQLFDQTRDVHDLGDTDRELLGYAARLHDVGARISPDKHHKHGAYVVENAGLRGFSPDEVALLACLVRFHRGGGPRSTYPPYAALTPVERHAGRILMGILRVAHGLGHGAVDDITDIGVSVGDRGLTIRLDGKNPHRAMLDAQERSDIFERAIGMPTSFEIVASGSLAR